MRRGEQVSRAETINRNRRTYAALLMSIYLFAGVVTGGITYLISRSLPLSIAVATVFGLLASLIASASSSGTAIRRTYAVLVPPEDAQVLHDLVDGLCIGIGMPKPRIYLIDDPSPNACSFGRGANTSGIAVTQGLLNLLSRRELEGVLAHELVHIDSQDVAVTTLGVAIFGGFAMYADAFTELYDSSDFNPLLLPLIVIAWPLKLVAGLTSLFAARHREEIADARAVAIVPPMGLRSALEKLEADAHVLERDTRGTSPLWFVAPMGTDQDDDDPALTDRWFDTHPPLRDRIAALRTFEGLDPNARGPVDATPTGVPVQLEDLLASRKRSTRPNPGWVSKDAAPTPNGKPPGWYPAGEQTLRYWGGQAWSEFTRTWDGKQWVKGRTTR